MQNICNRQVDNLERNRLLSPELKFTVLQDLSLGLLVPTRNFSKVFEEPRSDLGNTFGSFDHIPGGDVEVLSHLLKYAIVRRKLHDRRDSVTDRRAITGRKYNYRSTGCDKARCRFLIVAGTLHQIDA